jgi:hypothetical protein
MNGYNQQQVPQQPQAPQPAQAPPVPQKKALGIGDVLNKGIETVGEKTVEGVTAAVNAGRGMGQTIMDYYNKIVNPPVAPAGATNQPAVAPPTTEEAKMLEAIHPSQRGQMLETLRK